MVLLFASFLAFFNSAYAQTQQTPADSVYLAKALNAEQAAISGMEQVLQTNRASEKSKAKERTFLIRLSEQYTTASDYAFKLTNAKALEQNSAVNKKTYDVLLDKLIKTASDFIKEFPSDPAVIRMTFLKGRALMTRERSKEAIVDFSFVVDRAPNAPEAIPSMFMLNDLLVGEKEYAKALTYLEKVPVPESHEGYLLLVHDRALNYFQLDNIAKGMLFTRIELNTLKTRTNVSSEVLKSQRESALSAAATYYAGGFHKKIPGLSIGEFMSFLEKNTTPLERENLIRILAYSLASDAMEKELQELAQGNATIGPFGGISDIQKLDLFLFTFEHQRDQKLYPWMQKTLTEIQKVLGKVATRSDLRENGTIEKARLSLTGTSAYLQKDIDSTEDKEVKLSLIGQIYETLLWIPGSSIEQQARYHFNLGEAAFVKKDFAKGTIQYSWVIDHSEKVAALASLRDQAQAKVLSAQYEDLKARGLIPNEVKVAKIAPVKPDFHMDPSIDAWILRIQTAHQKQVANNKNDPLIPYLYESNRVIYANGKVEEGATGLKNFAITYPESDLSAAAGSLVIDTYLASEKWDLAIATIEEFKKISRWKDPQFIKKLEPVALEAGFMSIKAAQNDKKYDDVLHRVDLSLKQNPTFHREELNALAAQAALALGKKDMAQSHLLELKGSDVKNPEFRSAALLSSASTEETAHQFAASSVDLKNYFALVMVTPALAQKQAKNNTVELRKKALFEAWLSGKPATLKELLDDHSVCVPQLKDECRKYTALLYFMKGAPQDEMDSKELMALTQAQTVDSPIWALLALNDADIPARVGLEVLSSRFEKLDSLVQLSLLPVYLKRVTSGMGRLREDVPKKYPLRMSKEAISSRVNAVKVLEAFYGLFSPSQWASVRQQVLFQSALLYFDFSNEMMNIPPPKGLNANDLASFKGSLNDMRLPFEGKAKTLLDQAFAAAPDDRVRSIYFKANPMATRSPLDGKSAIPVPEYFIDSVSDHELRSVITDKNIALGAFLLGEYKNNHKLKDNEIHTIRAMILSSAGATSESMDELQLALGSDANQTAKICNSLVTLAASSSDVERSKKLMTSCGDTLKKIDGIVYSELEIWLEPKASERMPATVSTKAPVAVPAAGAPAAQPAAPTVPETQSVSGAHP